MFSNVSKSGSISLHKYGRFLFVTLYSQQQKESTKENWNFMETYIFEKVNVWLSIIIILKSTTNQVIFSYFSLFMLF